MPEHSSLTDSARFETVSVEEQKLFVASQWQLIWWRFRKHKMALYSSFVLLFLYSIALVPEFYGPYNPFENEAKSILNPPMWLHIRDEEGKFHWPPFAYAVVGKTDPKTLGRTYTVIREQKIPIRFFVRGWEYKILGLIKSNIHLYGTDATDARGKPIKLFLLGADINGRDLVSRVALGARISLTVGLIGVFISLALGVLLGGLSGYFGGAVDMLIQRVIEFLRSIPHIPLWMTLGAALPPTWTPLQTYFAITIILAIIGWTSMARVVRGRFLALREEDFVMAARLAGSSELRIILRHMVPAMTSHLIASLTLSIPGMILGETSLSFLGLGLRPPVVSWGVLLNEGQSLQALALSPWLAFVPSFFIVVTVLAFNFLGDGLRDAADPYGH